MLQRTIKQVKEKVRDEGGWERPLGGEDIGVEAEVGSGQREQQMQKLWDQSMTGELEEQPGDQGGWSEGCKGGEKGEGEVKGGGLPSLHILGVSTSVKKGITWGHRSRLWPEMGPLVSSPLLLLVLHKVEK